MSMFPMPMRRAVLRLSLLAIGCVVSWTYAADLSLAPPGYTWKRFDKIQASFLVPNGWFIKEEQKGSTTAIFITKESIEKQRRFQTGLSVNVIKDPKTSTGSAPSTYAKLFIERMSKKGAAIKPFGDGTYLKGYWGLFRSKNPENTMVMQYTSALGNDKTGTLYIFIFESPESE